MAQQATDSTTEELATITTDAEAADVLATNLTSAELSDFSREHDVAGYSGLQKGAKAENIVRQAPEAVAAWLDEQPHVTPAEGLGEQMGGVDTLAEAREATGSECLRERLWDLEEALREAPAGYEVTDLDFDGTGWTSVRIKNPHEDYWNEGELGTTSVFLVLGENGGLKTAQYRDLFSGFSCDFTEGSDTRHAWDRALEKVRTADSGDA